MASVSDGEEIIREGVIVTLGHNMFSIPKLQWFSLRTTGLFYSAPRTRNKTKDTDFDNVIEFDTMFVRVEKIDEVNSKFCYGDDKVAVYCLRVGDKRKCRTLCFVSWEERDFWVISILHAIAQFKISNQSKERYGGKIRSNSSASLRSRSKTKHTPVLRHTRSECDRQTRSKPPGIRKRFSSLRSRKSMRDSREADLNEFFTKTTPRCEVFGAATMSTFSKNSRHSFIAPLEETCCSTVFCEHEEHEEPPSPRYKPWFEKLSTSVDFGMKRHFSSFMTKFT